MQNNVTTINRLINEHTSRNLADTAIRDVLQQLKDKKLWYVYEAREEIEKRIEQFQSLAKVTAQGSYTAKGYKQAQKYVRTANQLESFLSDIGYLEEIENAHCGYCGNQKDYEDKAPCKRCGSTARCIEKH